MFLLCDYGGGSSPCWCREEEVIWEECVVHAGLVIALEMELVVKYLLSFE